MDEPAEYRIEAASELHREPTTALSAATSIWRNEGPLAFYKGTLTPLLGIGACVSVQFGGFHAARRWFEDRNTSHHGALAGAPLSYAQYYGAGAFAGVANGVISGPIEHVRIRLQTQPHGAARLYAGPLDCVRKLVHSDTRHAALGLRRGKPKEALLWTTHTIENTSRLKDYVTSR